MSADFQFLMISAMYENGGNTTQRFLDGHPQMLVYPFESQLGTRLVNDQLSSVFPVKYRWPVFALDATSQQDYNAIIDEEGKIRARTPATSKFRHVEFDLSDDARCEAYVDLIKASGRSRPNNVAAFFQATFQVWKNFKRTPEQSLYVGYSPIVVVDADKILRELPGAHVLHVVRNPWSAYAETKRRPVPLSLQHYMQAWTLNQFHALLHAGDANTNFEPGLLFSSLLTCRGPVAKVTDFQREMRVAINSYLGFLTSRMALDVGEAFLHHTE